MIIERHHDYIFNLGTLAAGQITSAIQIPTDTDAPFILRAVNGYYIQNPGTILEAPVPLPDFLLWRYADADRNWLQTARTPGLLANNTQPTDYIPMRRHIAYPAQATIQMQFENATTDPIENAVVILRGVKLFSAACGQAAVFAPTYPDGGCYTTQPYQYATTYSLAAGQTIQNQPLSINDDADFVWRCTELDLDPATDQGGVQALEVRVRDPLGKAYASTGHGDSAWVRAVYLWGNDAAKPGIWYPEIYIGRGQSLVYDIRNMNPSLSIAGQFAADGCKVFSKRPNAGAR